MQINSLTKHAVPSRAVTASLYVVFLGINHCWFPQWRLRLGETPVESFFLSTTLNDNDARGQAFNSQ